MCNSLHAKFVSYFKAYAVNDMQWMLFPQCGQYSAIALVSHSIIGLSFC